jgi:hypothetical protein
MSMIRLRQNNWAAPDRRFCTPGEPISWQRVMVASRREGSRQCDETRGAVSWSGFGAGMGEILTTVKQAFLTTVRILTGQYTARNGGF